MKESDVAVAGELFVDHVFSGFERWPQPGEEHFTDQYVREAGGGAAITACALSRLGRSVAIFAVAGEQDVWLKDRLRSFAVGVEGLRTAPMGTAVSVSISTRDDRSFLTWPGANRELPGYLGEAEIQDRMARARHVHLAAPLERPLAVELFRKLRAAGSTISLDVGHRPDWLTQEENWKTCAEVDFFLPNEREGQIMTGCSEPERMIAVLGSMGIGGVVLKLGRAGAIACAVGGVCRAAAPAVDAVDSTGAGDAFDAGLIDAYLEGAGLAAMLERACLCGSLSTRKAGALAALPSREELDEFYVRVR